MTSRGRDAGLVLQRVTENVAPRNASRNAECGLHLGQSDEPCAGVVWSLDINIDGRGSKRGR
jgi:hypothetical protein